MGSTACLRRLRYLRISDVAERPLHGARQAGRLPIKQSRWMATVSDIPSNEATGDTDVPLMNERQSTSKPQNPITINASPPPITTSAIPPISLSEKNVTTTLYSFPYFEPLQHLYFSSSHLGVPMRKDLIHRAVVYEADKARQGTASTKWRSEVRGSGKKVRPQKGQGMARLGDRKSPSIRGGGVAHGPKPRDFSTKLPRKIYDMAWRMALTYRYEKGELVVVDKIRTPEDPENGPGQGGKDWWIKEILDANRWGRADGRSMIIAERQTWNEEVFEAMKSIGMAGKITEMKDAEVRHILSLGRIVIEKSALTKLIHNHQRDLKRIVPKPFVNAVGGANPTITRPALQEEDVFDEHYEEDEEFEDEEFEGEEEVLQEAQERIIKEEQESRNSRTEPRA